MQTLSQILGLFADKKNLHDSAGPVKTKGRSVQFCPRLAKTTTLHVHHDFLYIFNRRCTTNHAVKLPNFSFC